MFLVMQDFDFTKIFQNSGYIYPNLPNLPKF